MLSSGFSDIWNLIKNRKPKIHAHKFLLAMQKLMNVTKNFNEAVWR